MEVSAIVDESIKSQQDEFCDVVMPGVINVFGLSVNLLWQEIADKPPVRRQCTAEHFYLQIPEVAAYWVNPEKDQIVIEIANPGISYTIVATWLLGTVMAYLLQYHGYLVLHGSAVLINNSAVVFSGDSGAGKSTIASALVKQGYPLLTDDVVVIKTLADGAMVLVPGPAKLKLWADALELLEHSSHGLQQVVNKVDKYQFPVSNHDDSLYPISRFYELIPDATCAEFSWQELFGIDKLQLLIKNTYRYNMLKPLNKLKEHFKSCSLLGAKIRTFRIKRSSNPQNLAIMLELIKNHNNNIYT